MLTIIRTHASVNILESDLVRFVHGDSLVDALALYCKCGLSSSTWGERDQQAEKGEPYDLYLAETSMKAMDGAVGAILEAVNSVCNAAKDGQTDAPRTAPRAFVVIRPPGHHCDRSTPAGFCFINNIMIAAEHVFDIDLHHGDGTQRLILENRLGPSFFYGGIHDAKSFPCTDSEGQREALVQVARGEHTRCLGIHNVPLRAHRKPARFWEAYRTTYSAIITRATEAIEVSGDADDVLVIISCGFDASEHEDPHISLGKVHVPTEFYRRFTAEACAFADKYASGRLVSVLEGGYSDHALVSGTMAHVGALAEAGGATVDPKWWAKGALDKVRGQTSMHALSDPEMQIIECTQKPRAPGGKVVASWLKRTQEISRSLLEPVVTSKPVILPLAVAHAASPFAVAPRLSLHLPGIPVPSASSSKVAPPGGTSGSATPPSTQLIFTTTKRPRDGDDDVAPSATKLRVGLHRSGTSTCTPAAAAGPSRETAAPHLPPPMTLESTKSL
ncbi:hypothetical protein PsYK624_132070 [Phanerochaete sordida]|uniref:Histone deacetylase domain-containing protein n=1 Tax=Phanerochaete sordida TaxID=48140 RepID=A0A9P3GK52_9APHY|nr:hypothetical protein PsYK624_132070 [Phanerochaete sordida]